MSEHRLRDFSFASLTSERWDSLPNLNVIRQQIASAVLAHCEVSDDALGGYSPPKEIQEVKLTAAAIDQIECMWHGHRERDRVAPPTIPLKIFVIGFGQDGKGHTWVSIEVHPGLEDWEPR